MRRRRRDGVVAAILVLLPGTAAAQGLYLEGGLSWGRGDYTYTEPTSAGSAAVGLALSGRRLTARVTLPWFVRDTRLLTVAGEEPGEEVEPASGSPYEGSVSDPLFQVSVPVIPGHRTGVGISTSVKIPLVEAGYFGTGEWDASVAASLSQLVGSTTVIGFDVGYWWLGDPPDLDLQDTVTATVSVGRAFGRSWTASLSVSGGRSALAGYDDAWWVGLLAGRSFSHGIWGLTATVGLTRGAPDFTLGLVWRARLR